MLNLTETEIINLYIKDKKYVKDIAILANCSTGTVFNILKRNNIQANNGKISQERKTLIIEEYLSGLEQSEICKKYSMPAATVYHILKSSNISIRPKKILMGETHPLYKKNGYKGTDGYIIVLDKRLHRTLMETVLNRPLTHWEDVHHIDECRTNNELSNLVVMPSKEHNRFHTFLRHRNFHASKEYLFKFCRKESEFYYRFTIDDYKAAIIIDPCPSKDKVNKWIKKCSEENCDNAVYGLGLCNKHYQRMKAKESGTWKSGKGRISKYKIKE